MPWTVNTFVDEFALEAFTGGTVITFNSEQDLNDFLATITTETVFFVSKGNRYTVLVDPTVVNIDLRFLSKGAHFTILLETA